MVNFGNTLKELRQRAGLTQKQLADRLWLSKATVSYYEQSLRYPSPEILVRLAGVFHVSTDYLLGLDEKSQSIDVSDLTEDEISAVQSVINALRKSHNKKS